MRRLSALLLAVPLLGCATTLSPEQRQWLQDGRAAYADGKYNRAIEIYTRLIDQASKTPEAGEAYYVRGMSLAKVNNRAAAYSDLRQAASRTEDAEIHWKSNVVLGTLAYEDERWPEAARALGAAAQAMPAAPPLDLVLFRLGSSLERMGNWRAARAAFERLAQTFQNGDYAAAARRRLKSGANAFSIQCGAFSRRENADRLAADLRSRGFAPALRAESSGGSGSLILVLVGQYSSYAEAGRALSQIQRVVPDAKIWP
ncbi:MAG: SPOR domain-containing protein [Phycisphaerae bacterium]